MISFDHIYVYRSYSSCPYIVNGSLIKIVQFAPTPQNLLHIRNILKEGHLVLLCPYIYLEWEHSHHLSMRLNSVLMFFFRYKFCYPKTWQPTISFYENVIIIHYLALSQNHYTTLDFEYGIWTHFSLRNLYNNLKNECFCFNSNNQMY